MGYFALL